MFEDGCQPQRIQPIDCQENVWDYPHPLKLERFEGVFRIIHKGIEVVHSINSYKLMETASPPMYYIPQNDIQMVHFNFNTGKSSCEWKDEANYIDLAIEDGLVPIAAWLYMDTNTEYETIKDHIAFYSSKFDERYIDNIIVKYQSVDFMVAGSLLIFSAFQKVILERFHGNFETLIYVSYLFD